MKPNGETLKEQTAAILRGLMLSPEKRLSTTELCRFEYKKTVRGHEVTKHIADYRKRIQELRQAGYDIETRPIPGATDSWYILWGKLAPGQVVKLKGSFHLGQMIAEATPAALESLTGKKGEVITRGRKVFFVTAQRAFKLSGIHTKAALGAGPGQQPDLWAQ